MPPTFPPGQDSLPGGTLPPPQTLLSRDFLLLFCITMFCNSFIAVFYCFEQWLEVLSISPDWRGVLLSSMFAMVLVFRPLASFFLLRRSKLVAMYLAVIVSSCVMLAYDHASGPCAIGLILVLRMVQGIALAVFSSCTTSLLVGCIPRGQSARGFAIFSLTLLLPYSVIPAVAEQILPVLGGEPHLFAVTSLLGIPSLLMLIPLAPRLRRPELTPPNGGGISDKSLLWSVSHSGLFFIYLGCMTFSSMTILAIFFMKGLCTVTGGNPAWFFSLYTLTIILVRLAGSHRLDSLPRYPVTLACCAALSSVMLGFAWGPLWAFVPLTLVYGLGLGLLYPLLAAFVYDRSTPDTRSINSNVMMSTFDASGMLAPLVGGLIVNAGFGYRGVFVATALAVALCGCFVLLDRLRSHARQKANRLADG